MRTITTIIIIATALQVSSQGPLSLSLQQAMDMAAQQSYQVQASALEAEKSEARIKEVTAMGLPQIDAGGSLNNYLEVPTQVFPNFFGGDPTELAAVKFAVPWNMAGSVQLNQLIFDGSYIVGLRASRELRTRSQQELEKTRADARAQAAKAYLAALAAREGAELATESVPILQKSLSEAEAMVQQGFMEATDVDRLTIALASARDRERSFAQQVSVAMAYLRVVLGVPNNTEITLTDPLETVLNDPGEIALASQSLDLNSHVERQLAGTLVNLSDLEVRNQKAAYLPKLHGFFNYQQQSFGFDGPAETPWYPASLWGLQLSVPIFSSGMRSSRVKQSGFGLQQAEVNLRATEQRLVAEQEERAQRALTAQESFETERRNMELTQRIFERTSIKFTNGMSSSFELNQDQTQYLQTQTIYLNKLVDLLLARVELRKSLDLY